MEKRISDIGILFSLTPYYMDDVLIIFSRNFNFLQQTPQQLRNQPQSIVSNFFTKHWTLDKDKNEKYDLSVYYHFLSLINTNYM